MSTSPVDITSLKQRYEEAGQSHLFSFWDTLSAEQQAELAQQLDELDVARVNQVFHTAIKADEEARAGKSHQISPPPPSSVENTIEGEANPAKVQHFRTVGLNAIAQGQVGVLLMAGGQGTRLGSSAPKGCYDIGLPSHKSLFQIQAERILRLQKLAAEHAQSSSSVVIPWYIMTSGPTRKDTEAFFAQNKYFGLEQQNIIFFEQGTLPCLSLEGKILLETPSKVATAPDGNGGLYRALRTPYNKGQTDTVVSDLKKRGIKYLHAYGVDNCLVKVGDPIFLGVCLEQGVQAGVKVVKKENPKESVGVVALRDGKFGVVEYSEIPESLSEARDTNGELSFRAANIVNHFYTTNFLSDDVPAFEPEMAFHIARKKIPTVDLSTGEPVKPSTPNGMKLELFVFDVFPFCGDKLAVHEVARQEEFSPLKNAKGTGVDDQDTSRRDLLAQQNRWLKAAGAKVEVGVEVELSPLLTYSGEGLDRLVGQSLSSSGNIEPWGRL
ncbi:probable UDP-N-acetylglucosamine pyrophosphorylase [Melanopsichium pennsylvanicum]|uniref:UDP-N-acetylglucosamine diphosphorylase n=2 Tax=Melanopsichium pennsylvanicum TaxID=63383 RepID=A0AAJ5C4R3_9BASI|nr:probable UDP-N-acetylglucosamine pyrophosphorylase [Melanopsichium pennsylvanicum 4]SNX83803.1 probable UDP-N-acetylglucosamine pyrophosphorylase [Melanopsichium pennsylvanicum]